MSYGPKVFPVQLEIGKRYDPGTNGRGQACRAVDEPWWSNDTFTQTRGTYQHNAIDIMAPLGARVVSPVDGHVLESWSYQGAVREGVDFSEQGGWNVRLVDAAGNAHFFSHMLERPLVRPGQRVRAGQQLGLVGQTGNAASTCPHLHYQVRDRSGAPVNPVPKLRALFEAGGWRVAPAGSSGLLWAFVGVAAVGVAVYAWHRFR